MILSAPSGGHGLNYSAVVKLPSKQAGILTMTHPDDSSPIMSKKQKEQLLVGDLNKNHMKSSRGRKKVLPNGRKTGNLNFMFTF